MLDLRHSPIWPFVALVLLAGGILALAWWDWTYPGQIRAWWNGERVYRFYWRQLGWALLISEGVCLSLWVLSARVRSEGRGGLVRAAQPFLLATLVLAFFVRYTVRPLGVRLGSSVWTYGLVAVTAGVLAFPLSTIVSSTIRAAGSTMTLRRRGRGIICVLAVLYVSIFGFLSTARHASFRTHALDLGAMDQAAWNTIRGRVLERTPLYRSPAEGSRYESRLSDAKLELIFIPLSALYWLWADPRILLIVQTLFLAAGALPLYLLICDRQQSVLLATLLASAYLLYLPLHYVNMADFHASALMVPLLIAAWRAMREERWRWYYFWLVLAQSCRIDAVFAALALGAVIAMWQKGRRRHGLYTLALAAAWLAINFGIVVPLVRQAYGPGAGDLVGRRFGTLGGDAMGVFRTLVTRPAFVMAQFADREKLQTVFDLLAPLGFLPLLNPPALLPALPVLAINLLAESAWQSSVHAHYMAPVIPFVWIAAGEGSIWLAKKVRPQWTLLLATFIWINTFLVSYVYSPFPPGMAFHLAEFFQPSPYVENLRTVTALIPDGASVCAQSDIHPHVSQRRDASLFYHCQLDDGEEAEYVVLDVDATSAKSPLGHHAFYELVDAWLARKEYGVIAQQGGVLLLHRGAPRRNMPDVIAALDEYGRAFYRIDFVSARLPRRLEAGELVRVPVTLRNTGSQGWHSMGQLPVRLAYRWLSAGGAPLAVDALRTDLPHRVDPGQTVRLRAWLLAPPEPGQYTLEWDVLREGDAWFGDMGATTLRQQVTIR